MGRLIDSNAFSRNGKKGMRLTFKQRAPSAGVAERAIRLQAAGQFPVKAGDVAVLGSEMMNKIIGPLSTYQVDVFVPTGDLKGQPVQSGDTRLPDLT